METEPPANPLDEHELDEAGHPVHVHVDPYIPTGLCAICEEEKLHPVIEE